MIALNLKDTSQNDIKVYLDDNFDDETKKVVVFHITSSNNVADEEQELFYNVESKEQLNTLITWLVDMKKQLPD